MSHPTKEDKKDKHYNNNISHAEENESESESLNNDSHLFASVQKAKTLDLNSLSPILDKKKKNLGSIGIKKRNSHNPPVSSSFEDPSPYETTPLPKSIKKLKNLKQGSFEEDQDKQKSGFGKMSMSFANKSMNTLKSLTKVPNLISHPIDTLSGNRHKEKDETSSEKIENQELKNQENAIKKKLENAQISKTNSLRKISSDNNNNSSTEKDIMLNEKDFNFQKEILQSGSGMKIFLAQDKDIHCGWMKLRNTMKVWNSRWFVLRPGKLIYCAHEKDLAKKYCLGIIRLADCKIEEYQSKSEGFAIKIFHLLGYSIYSKYGLKQEKIKMASFPLTWSSCVLRCSSEIERKTWMDNIQLQIDVANSPNFKYDDPDTLNENDFENEIPKENISKEEEKEFKVNKDEFLSYFPRAIQNVEEQYGKEISNLISSELDEFKKHTDTRISSVQENIMNDSSKNDGLYRFSFFQLLIVIFVFIFLGKMSVFYI